MKTSVLRAMAWIALAAIVFVTVSPIGLRPDLGLGSEPDRVVGFFALGSLFALAYRRHLLVVLALLVIGAFAVEALQLFEPDRHPRLADASVKAVGAIAGLAFSRLLPSPDRQKK